MDKKNNQTNTKNDKDVSVSNGPKVWNDSEVKLLKKWAELSGSYRVLHDRAHRVFKYQNYCYTIPVIVFSTILGTASFSQTTFPLEYQKYIPMGIGSLNIISGIITTIAQFTRVSELSEANRVASIAYGKFSRNISTELSLPPEFRSYSGIDFVQICRSEFDRLVEQSPIIPLKILEEFMKEIEDEDIEKPDIMKVSKVEEYKSTREEKAASIIANAFQKMHNKTVENKKSGVQKMAELVERKGMAVINSVNKAMGNTPPAIKEVKDNVKNKVETTKEQLLEEGRNSFTKVNNLIQSKIDEESEDIEEVVLSKPNFINQQIENRKKELESMNGSGMVGKLIKQKSINLSSSSFIPSPSNNTKVNDKISNLVQKAKHSIEETSDVINDIHLNNESNDIV